MESLPRNPAGGAMSYDPTTGKQCLRCGYRVTWAEQRRQYGRLIRRGKSDEEAKALMPRCQKCTTAALKGRLTL